MSDPSYEQLVLNRMEIEDVGFNPERLANAVHQQVGTASGAVPVTAIASALDIIEIRYEPLTNLEGALLMPADRNCAAILVNKKVGVKRQRFTLAHELGHYLNLRHRPQSEAGFACTRNDMLRWGGGSGLTPDQRQELEANQFAIALLAPRSRIRPALQQSLDLSRVVALAGDLQLSKEAMARRFVELHDDPIAIVFSKNERCRYVVKSRTCGSVSLQKGLKMPLLPAWDGPANPTGFVDADPEEWLYKPDNCNLPIQTLWQQDGHCMTLMVLEEPFDTGWEDEHDDGIEDTVERYGRF